MGLGQTQISEFKVKCELNEHNVNGEWFEGYINFWEFVGDHHKGWKGLSQISWVKENQYGFFGCIVNIVVFLFL